ncbi:MAG: hypothetical protein Q8O94_02690 [bacterium]|nr:hypothetical protein [bacterium]
MNTIERRHYLGQAQDAGLEFLRKPSFYVHRNIATVMDSLQNVSPEDAQARMGLMMTALELDAAKMRVRSEFWGGLAGIAASLPILLGILWAREKK